MRSISTRAAGLLLVVLGVWGGLVPFVGHYFHFALGPDKAWTWAAARFYLDVLPGVATVLGGLILMGAGPRGSARLGALLALAGGIWFAIGPEISQLWHAGGAQGAGHGSAHIQMLEMLTYHTGLGVVTAALAGARRRGRVGGGGGAGRRRGGGDAAPEPGAGRDWAGADQPVGGRDMASSAGQPVAADTGPARATGMTRSGDYSGRSTMRRRRGGLLGSLLRR